MRESRTKELLRSSTCKMEGGGVGGGGHSYASSPCAALLGRFDTVDCPMPGAEECFTAFLSDTYGDGWNGSVLTIENEGTGEVVHQLTQSGYITAFVEEAFEVCFECGSCFAADVGGGTYEEETAWNIKDAQGSTIAEGSGVGGGEQKRQLLHRLMLLDCLRAGEAAERRGQRVRALRARQAQQHHQQRGMRRMRAGDARCGGGRDERCRLPAV